MTITQDKFVAIHYTVKLEDGTVLDSSEGKEPLGYVHGHNNLITGLEKELEGKAAGDKLSAVIQPGEAYGEYDDKLVMDVPKSQFETSMGIEVGMMFQAMSPQGPILVRVVEINDDSVKIDGNHELAGKVLHFDVEVVEVRDATEEELNPPSCGCGGCGGGCGGDCNGDCGGDCNGDCGDGGCGCGGEGGCGCGN